MNPIDKYIKAKQDLYDSVGFIPSYVECAIDDCTDLYWFINEKSVKYSNSIEEMNSGGYWEDQIYTQRFYKQHMFVGKELTMVMCDTQQDTGKWFRFFSNDKNIGFKL